MIRFGACRTFAEESLVPSIITAQVRFTALTNKTEDDITNTWHFVVETVPPPAATLTAIGSALGTFYGSIQPQSVADWAQGFTVKYYNVDDPKPRAPIYTSSLGGAAWGTAGKAVPRELAPCLSFKGATTSGVPMSRRRGRIYLPTPTNGNLDNNGRLIGSYLTTVKNAANTLLTASDANSDWTWVIYSPTSNAAVPVIGGWVDDAPDIQRRRGIDASTRVVFP